LLAILDWNGGWAGALTSIPFYAFFPTFLFFPTGPTDTNARPRRHETWA
jgi:hypothetical protein